MRHLSWIVVLMQAGPALAQEKPVTLTWNADWVTAVALAGPSRQLVAGNRRGEIAVWTLDSGPVSTRPTRRLDGHTNQITHLAATPDGRWLVSASLDHTVRIWDLQAAAPGKGKLVLRVEPKTGKEEEVEVAVQEAVKVLTGHSEWVRSLALAADGKHALSGDDGGLAILWQIPEGKEVNRIQTQGWLRGVALAPDARQAVICTFSPRSTGLPTANLVWDLDSGKQVRDLGDALEKTRGTGRGLGMEAADYSRDGKTLALAEGGEFINAVGKVFLVDAAAGKKLHELPAHSGGAVAVAFSPDNRLLATSGRDTTVRVWQVSDGKKVGEFGKPRGGQFPDWIHAVAWSGDGQWLAAGDMAGFIHLYKVAP